MFHVTRVNLKVRYFPQICACSQPCIKLFFSTVNATMFNFVYKLERVKLIKTKSFIMLLDDRARN